MPGTTIIVKWPAGEIRVKQEECDIWDYVKSADPNGFYRPYLEENVGKQHWSWDWTLGNNGAADNTLTIKFRKGKEAEAMYCALMWA